NRRPDIAARPPWSDPNPAASCPHQARERRRGSRKPSGCPKGQLGLRAHCLAWRSVILYPGWACAWTSLCRFASFSCREGERHCMANVVVVGPQWGDEGKGKIVDWLSEQADIVVRFQGGHNAGHTLVIDGATYKLSLLPSGVVRSGKLSVIGNGVVLDPRALLEEIDRLQEQGGD